MSAHTANVSKVENFAVLDSRDISVMSGEHSWERNTFVSVHIGTDGAVSIHATDNTNHTTIFMTRDEGIAFARAMLDTIL